MKTLNQFLLSVVATVVVAAYSPALMAAEVKAVAVKSAAGAVVADNFADAAGAVTVADVTVTPRVAPVFGAVTAEVTAPVALVNGVSSQVARLVVATSKPAVVADNFANAAGAVTVADVTVAPWVAPVFRAVTAEVTAPVTSVNGVSSQVARLVVATSKPAKGLTVAKVSDVVKRVVSSPDAVVTSDAGACPAEVVPGVAVAAGVFR